MGDSFILYAQLQADGGFCYLIQKLLHLKVVGTQS